MSDQPAQPTTSLPLVGVMPVREVRGIHNLEDEVEPLVPLTIDEALRTAWETDAHFVPYRAVNTGQHEWPRINKTALGKLRNVGADVLTRLIVLDWDTPGHVPITAEVVEERLNQLQALYDTFPIAMGWHAFYTSKNGCRFVYVLDQDVRVDEIENRIRWMVHQFRSKGIHVDELCDWTRVFRLPQVVRDSAKSQDAPTYMLIEQWENAPIPVASLGTMQVGPQKTTLYIAPVEISGAPIPDPDDARRLCYTLHRGEWRSTEWCQKAKKRLKGRDCFPTLFENAPLAEKGSRDQTLHAYLGAAVSCLLDIEGTTPEHVFGLFIDCVQQLEPDEGTPNWMATLWSGIRRLWAKEVSKRESVKHEEAMLKAAEEQKHMARKQTADQLCLSLLNGVREWCTDYNFLNCPPEEDLAVHQMEWICRRMIVSHINNYYVMRPDGYYDCSPLGTHQLIARLRVMGLDCLIETERAVEGDSRMSDVPVSQIIGRHATIVRHVEAVPQIDGGRIKNADSAGASLVVPSFRRNPKILPKFNQDVDGWLRAMFGEHYSHVNHWVAWALAFEEGPICALSIEAEQGVGKKMFVRGLAECLEHPVVATGADLSSQYQYGILESPFLVVNEGWPPGTRGKHPADMFREIVSGDTIEINRRYMAPVRMNNPMRIILTANNNNVVQMLAGGKDLSPEDRAALAIRLTHIKIGGDGAKYLRLRGGIEMTGRKGARWVEGDCKEPSDYIVASHFLWLHANRRGPVGARLLVEGDAHQQVIEQMRVNGGSTPLVIECLVKMLEQKRTNRDGLVVHQGRVWVTSSEIVDFFRSTISSSTKGASLTIRTVNDILKSLVVSGEDYGSYEHPQRQGTRKRWHEIDLDILLSAAQRDGWKNEYLSALLSEQHNRRAGLWKPDPVENNGTIPVLDSLRKKQGLTPLGNLPSLRGQQEPKQ